MCVTKIEKGSSVRIHKIALSRLGLDKTVLIDIKLTGIRLAAYASRTVMQSRIGGIGALGIKTPLANLRQCKSDLPDSATVPERGNSQNRAGRFIVKDCIHINSIDGIGIVLFTRKLDLCGYPPFALKL